MASSSSQSEMLFVGQQCSDEHCYLVDFLPFKCQHCSKMYCGDHFKPADHNCEKYDASKFDRVAPSCPICNLPVAMPPGQDPNIKMTDHIERECGKRKEEVSKVPRCANGKCHKVLYAPIKCDTCQQQFCAEHRFPTTHKCVTQTTFSATAVPRQDTTGQAKAGAKFKQAVGVGSAKTNAGMAAVRRAMVSSTSTSTSTTGTKPPARVSSQAQSSTPTTKSTAPSSHTNPFSKSDRWVTNPLESSIASHAKSTIAPTPRSPTSNTPFKSTTGPTTHGSCKSDLMTEPTMTTTSYQPPPLFAH